MLKINGVAVATPKVFKVDISDIDGETSRNAKGNMIRDRVATKRRLTCEWPLLATGEISQLLNSVKNVFFSVEYPDPMVGSFVTKTFYVGDRSTPMLYMKNGVAMWEGLSMNFIER